MPLFEQEWEARREELRVAGELPGESITGH
jgi:hypothetical protein